MSGFMKKLKDGVDKGVATVGANSKAMVEKSKVKTAINNLEGERKQLCQLLGQKIYDTYTETAEINADESVTSFIFEITKRVELIKEQNEEMARIEEELNRVVGSGQPAAMPPQDGLSCSCGRINSATAKFCAGCGSPMAQNAE